MHHPPKFTRHAPPPRRRLEAPQLLLRRRRRPVRIAGWILAWTALVIAAACLLLFTAAAHAARRADSMWQHPDFARFGVRSIALLPVATYDHSVQTQTTVAGAWGQRFQQSGYRWMTPSSSASMIRSAGGDSLTRLVQASILDQGRVDSLLAPGLAAQLHVHALLSLRVDRWDQIAIEADQRGKPASTVGLTAALVNAEGRLLWRGSGTETVEGLEHVPMAGGAGDRIGEAQLAAGTADTRPPAFAEVLTRLLARWSPMFPAPPAAPAPAADSSHTH